MRRLTPAYILQKTREGADHGSLDAYTMFIDISGFTAMTHTLMKNGKEGAEILTRVINRVFTPAIDSIYSCGGFISTFAGDAFNAIFPFGESQASAVLEAAQHIQESFRQGGRQNTKFGVFDLSVKIGLSGGRVSWGVLYNQQQNAYFFRGPAVDGAAHSEHNCDMGDIVVDSRYLEAIDSSSVQSRDETHWLWTPTKTISVARIEHKTPEPEDCSAFMPQTVIKQSSEGEFRDIVACFMSFRECEDWADSISRVIELTHEFGGYFNKIDFGDKGGVALTLFGAPIGREKLHERALSYALAIRAIPGFDVRIGVTWGTCFTGFVGAERRCEYTAIGMVVNLAARFMMSAKWGDIFVDRYLHKMEHERFHMDFVGAQVFKGFSEPIPVYLLVERKAVVREVSFEGETVGREAEMTVLRDAWTPMREGRFGGLVSVDGAAGIGKSRLTWQLRQEVGDEAAWFYLPCDEVLRKSFNPIEHWLRIYFQLSDRNASEANRSRFDSVMSALIGSTDDHELAAELDRTRSLLGALVGVFWTGSLYERLDARGRYENTLDAVKNLIKAESLIRPVVIELDDAHWIDPDSREWLVNLCRHIEDYPILILAACRFNDDGGEYDLGVEGITPRRIRLVELAGDNSRKLLLNRLSAITGKKVKALPDDTFDLIWSKSEGNPFFLEQILLYLVENDKLDDNFSLLRRDLDIPSQINAIIIARIDRLADDIKETIKTASVLGKEFLLSILTGMLGKLEKRFDLREIDQLIEKGEDEDIWNPVQEIRYIFKHALVRESVYEIQLKKRLRMLHGLAAETIEMVYEGELNAHFADLAYHYDAAENREKAIVYTAKAGRQAKHDFQNQQALAFFSRHIQLVCAELGCTPEEPELFEVTEQSREMAKDLFASLLERKYLVQMQGRSEEAESIIRAALSLAEKIDDDEILGKAHLDLANLLKTLGRYDEANDSLDKALGYFDKQGVSVMTGMVYLDRGIIRFFTGKRDEAFEDFQRELDIFTQLDDKPRIAEALGNLGVIYRYIGEPEKAMDHLRRQLSIASDLDDKIQIARVQSNIGWVFEGQGDFEQALDFYERSLEGNRELGLKAEIVRLLDNIGFVNQELGRHLRALDYHNAALEIAMETGDVDSMANITINTGHAHKALGEHGKAEARYDEAATLIEKHNLRYALPEVLIEKADLYYRLERYVEAHALNEEGLKIARELGSAEFIERGEQLQETLNKLIQ